MAKDPVRLDVCFSVTTSYLLGGALTFIVLIACIYDKINIPQHLL